MGLKATNRHARCAAVSLGMLLSMLSALPSNAAAQAKRYGDVSYAQPSCGNGVRFTYQLTKGYGPNRGSKTRVQSRLFNNESPSLSKSPAVIRRR